jgi:hypothetical protein
MVKVSSFSKKSSSSCQQRMRAVRWKSVRGRRLFGEGVDLHGPVVAVKARRLLHRGARAERVVGVDRVAAVGDVAQDRADLVEAHVPHGAEDPAIEEEAMQGLAGA